MYNSLCQGDRELEEWSNKIEPFALDFGLVCMGFLYDCKCSLRDSNSAEVDAIYAIFLSYIRERIIAIMFQVENLELHRIIQ